MVKIGEFGLTGIVTSERIGQEWQKCPFEWGMEKYVTIASYDSGRLILMNVNRVTEEGWSSLAYTPVLSVDLGVYAGESIKP